MLKMKITVPRSLPHFPTIYIRNVPDEDVEIMVSFDVTSLYTNIPVIDMLNIRIMLIMMINLLGKQLYLKTNFLV